MPGTQKTSGAPARVVKKWVTAATQVDGCMALNSGTAGAIDFTDQQGTEHLAYPIHVGYNPLRPRSIDATALTNLWALWV